MNKLLQNVVNNGTGTAAQLSNKHVAGKTGTTEDWNDLTFVGLTEDFVSGVWIGYTPRQEIPNHGIKSAQIWQNIIGEYANSLQTDATYPACDTVIEDYTCAESGKIAGPNCKKGPIDTGSPAMHQNVTIARQSRRLQHQQKPNLLKQRLPLRHRRKNSLQHRHRRNHRLHRHLLPLSRRRKLK